MQSALLLLTHDSDPPFLISKPKTIEETIKEAKRLFYLEDSTAVHLILTERESGCQMVLTALSWERYEELTDGDNPVTLEVKEAPVTGDWARRKQQTDDAMPTEAPAGEVSADSQMTDDDAGSSSSSNSGNIKNLYRSNVRCTVHRRMPDSPAIGAAVAAPPSPNATKLLKVKISFPQAAQVYELSCDPTRFTVQALINDVRFRHPPPPCLDSCYCHKNYRRCARTQDLFWREEACALYPNWSISEWIGILRMKCPDKIELSEESLWREGLSLKVQYTVS